MIRSIAALVWLTLLTGGAYAQTAPYDFRGVQLGITLDEFRAMPVPDGVGGPGETVIVACRGGAVNEASALCQWALPDRPGTARRAYDLNGQAPPPEPAAVTLGLDRGAASFVFIRDEDGALKLYEISLSGNARSFSIVEAGLIERFGPPHSRERGAAVTGLGISTPQDTLSWRNGASTITARAPAGSVDAMTVVYEHTRLSALAHSREGATPAM